MCVPYSFVITAKGEILDGKNMDHHTNICKQHGVEYDLVLKPEYKIWNRKLVDLEPRVSDVHMLEFKAFLKDGMLKERYYNLAENHVNKKFTDWKSGLAYFEDNWQIVKKYVPQLVTSTKGLVDFDERDNLFMNYLSDFEWFKKWVEVSWNTDATHRAYYQYHAVFKPIDWSDDYMAKVFGICEEEIGRLQDRVKWLGIDDMPCEAIIPTMRERGIQERLQYELKKFHCEVIKEFKQGQFKLSGSGLLTFEQFMKHWSKKDNRVECWK